MTLPAGPMNDEDLHAYVDRRLSPERQADVERWLANDADAAARVAFYTRMNAELHRRFDHVLAEPVPREWGPTPVWHRRLRDRRAPTIRNFAVAACWLFAGILGGWTTHDLLIPPKVVERIVEVPVPMAEQAAVAHGVFTPEVRHPVEVRADEDHLLRWLSTRMGKPIKAPNLDAEGWRLMGGRLLPVAGEPESSRVACQFMFEKPDGSRVTLYFKSTTPGDGTPTAFRFAEEGNGLGVFYWSDTKLGYALVGKLPKDELKNLARLVYDQFNS
jgi:anti-sigma factor RsiW